MIDPTLPSFTDHLLVSKQELVPYLLQQITDQKRYDASQSGAPAVTEGTQAAPKETPTLPDSQVVLPPDTKRRKQVGRIYEDRGQSISYLSRTIIY